MTCPFGSRRVGIILLKNRLSPPPASFENKCAVSDVFGVSPQISEAYSIA
jgi:hypothetical protein